jgi:hypothetical protein
MLSTVARAIQIGGWIVPFEGGSEIKVLILIVTLYFKLELIY